jgi:hypothetical protein
MARKVKPKVDFIARLEAEALAKQRGIAPSVTEFNNSLPEKVAQDLAHNQPVIDMDLAPLAGNAFGKYVQLISERPDHVDRTYQTGRWSPLQIKDIPVDVAKNMLRHQDVYRAPDKNPDYPVQVISFEQDKKANEEFTKLYETLNMISLMGKDDVVTFLESNGWPAMEKGAQDDDSARQHARMCFDLYGVV